MTAVANRTGGTTLQILDTRQPLRRAALFVAILLSGGNLILPRVLLIVVLIGLALLLSNPAKLVRREMSAIWLALLLVLFLSLLAGGFDINAAITRYANFFGAILLLSAYLDEPRGTLTRDIFPVLALFAVQAILTPLLALAIPSWFFTFDIDDSSYHTLGFLFTYHDIVLVEGALKRPDGFFFEPGVLQIYLNIYLYLALIAMRRYGHAALAMAGVLATQSTTGVVITVLILAAAYLRRLRTAALTERLVVLILVPLFLIPVAMYAQVNIAQKFSGDLQGSAMARQYDLYTGLRIVGEYPLTGIGIDPERYGDVAWRVGYLESQLSMEDIITRRSSNGIITLAYMLGIPMFLVFMWGLLRQRFFSDRWVMFGILFVAFLGEALVLTPFFLMIIFSGLILSAKPVAAVAGRFSLRAT